MERNINVELFLKELGRVMKQTGIALLVDNKDDNNNKMILVDTNTNEYNKLDLEIVNNSLFGFNVSTFFKKISCHFRQY